MTIIRCSWANPANPRYLDYHDTEWGVPCHDENRLFEMLNLEGAQAGLSWETILNKRANYRAAFDGWDPHKIAHYGADKVALLLADFMAEGHFTRHIKRTRDAYAERREALLRALAERLPHELACGPADAGLDLCVHFRRALDQDRVARMALAQGVEVRPLSYYTSRVATPECAVAPGLLLGFSAIAPAHITPSLERLAKVIEAEPTLQHAAG